MILSLVPVSELPQALEGIVSTSPQVAYVCKEESGDAESMKRNLQADVIPVVEQMLFEENSAHLSYYYNMLQDN